MIQVLHAWYCPQIGENSYAIYEMLDKVTKEPLFAPDGKPQIREVHFVHESFENGQRYVEKMERELPGLEFEYVGYVGKFISFDPDDSEAEEDVYF